MPRTDTKTERNQTILKLIKAGYKQEEVAKQFEITQQRVNQIIQQELKRQDYNQFNIGDPVDVIVYIGPDAAKADSIRKDLIIMMQSGEPTKNLYYPRDMLINNVTHKTFVQSEDRFMILHRISIQGVIL